LALRHDSPSVPAPTAPRSSSRDLASLPRQADTPGFRSFSPDHKPPVQPQLPMRVPADHRSSVLRSLHSRFANSIAGFRAIDPVATRSVPLPLASGLLLAATVSPPVSAHQFDRAVVQRVDLPARFSGTKISATHRDAING